MVVLQWVDFFIFKHTLYEFTVRFSFFSLFLLIISKFLWYIYCFFLVVELIPMLGNENTLRTSGHGLNYGILSRMKEKLLYYVF